MNLESLIPLLKRFGWGLEALSGKTKLYIYEYENTAHHLTPPPPPKSEIGYIAENK
jgi:hypothetical protein